MSLHLTPLAKILAGDLGIDIGYHHAPKYVTPGQAVETPSTILKWYGLHSADKSISSELTELARNLVTTTPLEASGLGFVILHRCGNDFYFLIICTWRNSNELWETVFYKDGEAMANFAPFARDGEHKPTLCVWELVPVWHEQQAWLRFLNSSRGETEAQLWINDLFIGQA